MIGAVERWTRRAGLVATSGTLSTLLWGIWRGTRRQSGQTVGRTPEVLRSLAFYVGASAGYFALCAALWRDVPWTLSRRARAMALVAGSLLYSVGLALVAWGRLTLAQMYNVSSTFGAQLYADQQLVTHGPYALVRHPMYLGVLLTAVGGIFLYRTWTFVFLLLHAPVLVLRARWEEQALALTFGQAWQAYCRRVPGWIPAAGAASGQEELYVAAS